jgi:hypothetical protein
MDEFHQPVRGNTTVLPFSRVFGMMEAATTNDSGNSSNDKSVGVGDVVATSRSVWVVAVWCEDKYFIVINKVIFFVYAGRPTLRGSNL